MGTEGQPQPLLRGWWWAVRGIIIASTYIHKYSSDMETSLTSKPRKIYRYLHQRLVISARFDISVGALFAAAFCSKASAVFRVLAGRFARALWRRLPSVLVREHPPWRPRAPEEMAGPT